MQKWTIYEFSKFLYKSFNKPADKKTETGPDAKADNKTDGNRNNDKPTCYFRIFPAQSQANKNQGHHR